MAALAQKGPLPVTLHDEERLLDLEWIDRGLRNDFRAHIAGLMSVEEYEWREKVAMHLKRKLEGSNEELA